MTQIAPLDNQARAKPNGSSSQGTDPEAQAFREALAQQSLNQLSEMLDPSATASLPGAGVALAEATAAPPADATSLAAAELVRQDRQQSIRDRGLDAASASQQELRSRTNQAASPSPSSASAPPERGAGVVNEFVGALRQPVEPAANSQMSNQAQGGQQQPPANQPSVAATPHAPSAIASGAAISSTASRVAASVVSAPSQPVKAVQAVNSMSAAVATTKQAGAPTQAFSIERAAAKTDRAAYAKPAAAPAQRPDPTAQIQRGLAQVLRQQGGTLTMKLTPNELGEVKIALQMQQSRVTGTIDAQTVAARDLLTTNIDALKASLEQRGVTVDRLDVRLQGAAESDTHARSGAEPRHEHASTNADTGGDRHSGSTGREDRHAGNRDGAPGRPETSDDRGAATPVRGDGQGRPDEPVGQRLRLDTTA
ncbi:MAG: flagellar hook-length control protein FliK [Planctomycetota bacterium]